MHARAGMDLTEVMLVVEVELEVVVVVFERTNERNDRLNDRLAADFKYQGPFDRLFLSSDPRSLALSQSSPTPPLFSVFLQ